MTRTDKAIRNVVFTILSQIIVLLTSFITRKIIAVNMFPEYLGVGGLFTNILTVLSLAELGFGTSITYSLYKPLADNDEKRVSALMNLFRVVYISIGLVIFAIGLGLTPFLSLFVDDYSKVLSVIPEFKLLYVLYVINTSVSYLFSYKRTLLIADQKKYLTSIVSLATNVVLCVLTCVILAYTHNYVFFMIATISITIIDNVIVTLVANREYRYLKNYKKEKLLNEDSKEIKTNVSATILHNVGGVIVNGTDNILISKFVSFLVEGIYSNYHLVTAAIDSILRLLIQSVTPSYGMLTVDSDNEKKINVFNNMFFASSWMYGFSAICLFVLIRPFVLLWLGSGFELDSMTIVVIVANFYVTGMRRPTLLAKEAMGLMRYDKWKSIVEAILNLAISIVLALKLGIIGVLLGTLISTLLTCFWVEPYVVYHRGFGIGTGSYFAKYVVHFIATLIGLFITSFICKLVDFGGIGSFVVQLLICLIIPNIIYALVYLKSNELKFYLNFVREKTKKIKD
ncbi:MAG: hypothetical protein MJ236_01795 [Clostridia bacterium]|nr:hypothetical protein [Clostridia bacterium]